MKQAYQGSVSAVLVAALFVSLSWSTHAQLYRDPGLCYSEDYIELGAILMGPESAEERLAAFDHDFLNRCIHTYFSARLIWAVWYATSGFPPPEEEIVWWLEQMAEQMNGGG